MKTLDFRKQQFKDNISPFLSQYGNDLLNDFYLYWTEINFNGKKMRFEKEKTFGISRRLSTWNKNNKNWNTKKEKVDAASLIQQKYGLS